MKRRQVAVTHWRSIGLAAWFALWHGGEREAAAEPPPPDYQNPYVLDWGRSTPDQPADAPPRAPRPMTAAEKRQAAYEATFLEAMLSYEAGRDLPRVAELFRLNAEKGDRRAEFLYAECLRLGRGVAVDFDAAFRWYTLAKAHGHPDAATGLALLASDRAAAAEVAKLRVAQDLQQAARARIEAAFGRGAGGVAELRGMEARGELGPADEARLAALLSSTKVKVARGEVLGLYAKAEAGGEFVWLAVAGLYLDGKGGVGKNARQGLKILESHVALGDALAMMELGRRYEGGLGVGRSLVKALDWYTQAGAAGLAARARIYEQGGPGVARDLGSAVGMYRTAYEQARSSDALRALDRMADAGSVDAQAALGFLGLTGRLSLSDRMDSALSLELPGDELVWRTYEAAAAKNDPDAQVTLGRLYLWQAALGESRKSDPYQDPGAYAGLESVGKIRPGGYPEALHWFELAAAHGHAEAMYQVGRLVRVGVASGLGSALSWYEKAAALGHAEAMYEIGKLVEAGVSGLGSARSWYERAAAAGSAMAKAALQH